MTVQLYNVKSKFATGLKPATMVYSNDNEISGFVVDAFDETITVCLFKPAEAIDSIEIVKEQLTDSELREYFEKALEKNPSMVEKWIDSGTKIPE